ncbi:MAG: FlgD immunoglobulin-like domain containing protein [Elusimicrobiales bacterium]|nr:FlgD immunoglobulin-like domain containing protein [Elusimicrobiales bacterium]
MLMLPALSGALFAGPGQHGRSARLSPLADSLRPAKAVPSSARIKQVRDFSDKSRKPWRVRFSPRTALPESIVEGESRAYGPGAEAAAAAFLDENREMLSVDRSELRLAHSRTYAGITHLQYEQVHKGLPVEFAYVRVHLTADGRVTGYQAKYEPAINISLSPSLSAEAAKSAVLSDLGYPARSEAKLVIFPDEFNGGLKLAWKIRARGGALGSGIWIYYVDAHDGSVLFRYDDLRRAACTGSHDTTGTVRGLVFPVSPYPTSTLGWQQTSTLTIRSQYVWVKNYSSAAVTDTNGIYCAGDSPTAGLGEGKVFAGLKGPYFSVSNFRGPGGHFDNGSGVWMTKAASVVSQPAYAPDAAYEYDLTVNDSDWNTTYPSGSFAKVVPRFNTFSVGSMDEDGVVLDADHVVVVNGAGHVKPGARAGSYRGTRTSPFYGAAVESPSYKVRLVSDEAGNSGSFTVTQSSYLVLTNNVSVPNNATGSFIWNHSRFMDGRLDEVNAFYHLNAIRDFFTPVNKDPSAPSGQTPADLDRPVEVMVRAHGRADQLNTLGGMLNAFYDLESDHIYFGDGPVCQGSSCPAPYSSFALDGTVVRHEYIHLVINRIYPIINFGEFGAISEAMADYFAISSFIGEGQNVPVTGLYIDEGEAASRDLSGTATKTDGTLINGVKVMPTHWHGEIHDDSLFLSQALYKLRNGTASQTLGVFNASPAAFAGLPRADVFAFAALFYFPDNFANFYEAFVDACRQIDGADCNADTISRISTAFNDHGIAPSYYDTGDFYETNNNASELCRNNNGPQCATDISTMTSVSASIYPQADVDYYGFVAPAGSIRAALTLPAGSESNTYHAYSLYLLDADRNLLATGDPVIFKGDTTYWGFCPSAGTPECLTLSPTVGLEYSAPIPGRYYIMVAAGPTVYYGNGGGNSPSHYRLSVDASPRGSATAGIFSPSYDRDEINFAVPYTTFEMNVHPSSDTTSAELEYQYASLRDHNFVPIPLARTDLASGYLETVAGTILPGSDSRGDPVLNGRVRLKPGFSARYPAIGTVYLEVFGRNHMGRVMSMGVSNPLALSANRASLTTYENIISPSNRSAVIRYELLSAGTLTINAYTVSGALVKTIYSGPVPAGKGTVEWDGTNSSGGKAASGIYYIKAEGPGLDTVEKVAIVR